MKMSCIILKVKGADSCVLWKIWIRISAPNQKKLVKPEHKREQPCLKSQFGPNGLFIEANT